MAFGETDPSEQRGGAVSHQASVPGKVTFSRRELGDDDAEQVAVIIQAGSKEAPGAMLGANVAALK